MGKFNVEHLNSKTRAWYDALSAAQQAFFENVETAPTPARWENEAPVITVARMPAKDANLIEKFRWIEGDIDEKSEERIVTWRENFADATGKTYKEGQFPAQHVTFIFGFCPTDEEGFAAAVRGVPRHAFAWSHVQGLGHAGKEDCWVVRTTDRGLGQYLLGLRGDRLLNTNHADYVVTDGWNVTGGAFAGDPIPHVTLIRGEDYAQDVKDGKIPSMGVLVGTTSHFKRVNAWVGVEFPEVKEDGEVVSPAKKFKFARTVDLHPRDMNGNPRSLDYPKGEQPL